MNRPVNRTLTTMALAAVLAIPVSAWAGFTCWTNKDGVRECGDAVPPEYAQKKTETYSDQGDQLGVQKSQAEREKEQAEEQAKQNQLEAQKQKEEAERKAAAAQAAKDRVLLATFTSVDDINRALKRKLDAIDGSVDVVTLALDKTKQQLEDYQSRANGIVKRNKPVPKDLQDDIDMLTKQVQDKEEYISSKKKEREDLKAEYGGYAKRFAELMQQQPGQ